MQDVHERLPQLTYSATNSQPSDAWPDNKKTAGGGLSDAESKHIIINQPTPKKIGRGGGRRH